VWFGFSLEGHVMRLLWSLFLVCLAVAGSAAARQAEDPAHGELRVLRDELLAAVNSRDMERLLRNLHPDVVVTWQNAEVSRRPEGVRAYLDRMLSGPDSVVRRFDTSVEVDELTILHGGDAGVAFGSSRDTFDLRSGQSFELASRWSATVVRHEGAWKVAAFHASANLFDNPLYNGARRLLLPAGAVAGLVGAAFGGLIARARGRRKSA
jgi:ketosteroid isomerase-like protein